MYQASVMKDLILLDNGSTVSVFCNPELVENIHETEESLRLSINGGEVTTKMKATVPGYGEVWFTSKAITNISAYLKWKRSTELQMIQLKIKLLQSIYLTRQ
jgi:hypothetical protein